MRKIAIILLTLCFIACQGGRQVTDSPKETILKEAERDVQSQRYDEAMEKGLLALDAARKEGDAHGRTQTVLLLHRAAASASALGRQ